MSTAKKLEPELVSINKRGQLTIPKKYRDALRMSGQTNVQIVLDGDEIKVVPVKIFPVRHSLAKPSTLREKVVASYKEAKEGNSVSVSDSNALFQTEVGANTTKKQEK